MTYLLTWMLPVLTAAGLTVHPYFGWETRGHGDFGPAKGVLLHHTAGASKGNMPSIGVLVKGRADLAGPVCNLGVARDGSFYLIAAGRAWHAGMGVWQGVHYGNKEFIGIECENTGLPDDKWPDDQMHALRLGVAALLDHMKAAPIMCAGHKEYCLPHGRKVDPSFNMNDFRKSLGHDSFITDHPVTR